MQILIVSSDPALVAELPRLLATIENGRTAVRHEHDLRRAAEAARSWRPEVILLQVTHDAESVRLCIHDILCAVPDCSIIAVYRAEALAAEMSESDFLIQAVRWGVKDFVRIPLAREEFRAVWERVSQRTGATVTFGRIVSFASNKGGVGKTSLAVNTAVELALHHPERVLLIDCSLQMGVCASTLHLRPATTIVDAARERQRLDETLLRQLAVPHESGLDLLAAPADAIEAMEVSEDVIVRLLALARRSYDYVVVDTFPMFDRIVMSVLDVSDRTYVVTDNLVPTVLGVSHLLKVLANLGYVDDKISLVVNRALRILGSLSVADIERKLGRPVSHFIPFDKRVIAAANIGKPFAMSNAWFSQARSRFRALAMEVMSLPAEHSGRHATTEATASTSSTINRTRVLAEETIRVEDI